MTLRRRVGTLLGVILALGVSGLGLVASQARAAGKPKTATFALPTDEFSRKAASVLGHLVRENFRRAKEFDLIDVRHLLNKGAQDTRLRSVKKAHKLLAKGKEQYDDLELDVAIEVLGKAQDEYKKAVGRFGDGQKYLEILLFLGASHILSGDAELGADAFRSVALFDKRKTLDAKMFPPSMIDIFNGAKAQAAAAPVGMVQMKSNPPASEVYLNGVYKGITPVTMVKVPEGSHFVRVEKDGYLPWGQQVDFFATHEERVEATLLASPGLAQFKKRSKALLGDLDDDPPKKAIVEYGQWTGVEQLVVVEVKQRGAEVGVEAVLVQIDPPKRLAYRSANFDFTSTNFLTRADAFFTSLYREVKIPPAETVVIKGAGKVAAVATCNSDSDCAIGEICDKASGTCIPDSPEGDQFYEKWWFWTIVGGVAVVGAGAGVMTWYLMQPEEGAIAFSF
jgi:hypothetical protein